MWTVALREREIVWDHVTFCVCCDCLCVLVCTYISVSLCIGAFVSVCVCYSVLIWLCSQMTVPLYNMTLKCAKCGVISSADVSTTATSNAMLVPLIIFSLTILILPCLSSPSLHSRSPSLPPFLPLLVLVLLFFSPLSFCSLMPWQGVWCQM